MSLYNRKMQLLDTKDKVGGYKLTDKQKKELSEWRQKQLKINKNK